MTATQETVTVHCGAWSDETCILPEFMLGSTGYRLYSDSCPASQELFCLVASGTATVVSGDSAYNRNPTSHSYRLNTGNGRECYPSAHSCGGGCNDVLSAGGYSLYAWGLETTNSYVATTCDRAWAPLAPPGLPL